MGAPEINVVVSEATHITVIKALRILGFGEGRLLRAPIDDFGRIDPNQLPELDDKTILCLQAGEVNTGEFDLFEPLIARAQQAGAWVHVDGAFGLWARVSDKHKGMTKGIEQADSWTTAGHKWLNTPYDSAMAICKHGDLLADALQANAPYSKGEPMAQKSLTLEFSRRARGLPIWAALYNLGRKGMAELVENHIRQAQYVAQRLKDNGFQVLNRVCLNQVLVSLNTEEETIGLLEKIHADGRVWFGASRWQGRSVMRISLSSWRTKDEDLELLLDVMGELKA